MTGRYNSCTVGAATWKPLRACQFQRCFCILQVTFAEVSLASAALEFWQQETGFAFCNFCHEGLDLIALRRAIVLCTFFGRCLQHAKREQSQYRALRIASGRFVWWAVEAVTCHQSCASTRMRPQLGRPHLSLKRQDSFTFGQSCGYSVSLCAFISMRAKETELYCQAPALKQSLMSASRPPVCPFGPAAYAGNRSDTAEMSRLSYIAVLYGVTFKISWFSRGVLWCLAVGSSRF